MPLADNYVNPNDKNSSHNQPTAQSLDEIKETQQIRDNKIDGDLHQVYMPNQGIKMKHHPYNHR